MKYQITVIDDQPDSPLAKHDDRTPVLIRRRTDVDWERVDYGRGPHLLTAKDGSQALCGGPGVCPACERVSGWISVKERPKKDGPVLVLRHTMAPSHQSAMFFKRKGFMFAGEVLDYVTHWQPLPEPPTTE